MADTTVHLVQALLDNSGVIVAMVAFVYSRKRDNAKQSEERGALAESLRLLREEVQGVSRAVTENGARVTDMDHKFWSEKWPPVVAAIERAHERLDGHDHRISAIESKLDGAA